MNDARPSVPTDEPLDGFIDIGDAILWIASLGSHLSLEDTEEREVEARRKILHALGDAVIVAEGYREFVYSAIPAGAWARVGTMENLTDMRTGQAFFSIHSEQGGVLARLIHDGPSAGLADVA